MVEIDRAMRSAPGATTLREIPMATERETWPSEHHPGVGRPAQWAFIGEQGYYDIPLGLLRGQDTGNFLAADRLLDADWRASSTFVGLSPY